MKLGFWLLKRLREVGDTVKKELFATITFVSLIILLFVNLGAAEYAFSEPPDLFQKVNSYGTVFSQCPGNVSLASIQAKLGKIRNSIKTGIGDDEVNEMLEECKRKNFFAIKGRPISAEISECLNYTDSILKANVNTAIEYSTEDLLEECEIRAFFKQRFGTDMVGNYNQSFLDIKVKQRDAEFIERVVQKYDKSVVDTSAEGRPEKLATQDHTPVKVTNSE